MDIGDYLAYKLRRLGLISRFILAYLLGLSGLALSINLVQEIAIILYFVIGYMLNRYILSKLEWHLLYSTLSNVSIAKLTSFVFWPIVYPIIIFQLLVVRYL